MRLGAGPRIHQARRQLGDRTEAYGIELTKLLYLARSFFFWCHQCPCNRRRRLQLLARSHPRHALG